MHDDNHWMQRALELAERGRGYVEPNPLVGAVVVRNGELVGDGWHQRFGEAHAEVNALEAAGQAASGATLYVTLEPCCHHGKTPPCTEAILRSGVSRVVAAMRDPFPQVAGRGAELLRVSGIAVDLGVCETEARRLNAPYLTLLECGRPYVHLKWAMSLDGKLATRTGDSKWISGEASRAIVHQLRGRVDAILIGIGTALADDPLLTARPPGARVATRIVLDSRGRLPLNSQLAVSANRIPTMVVVSHALPGAAAGLRACGCEVLELPHIDDRPSLPALLEELGRRRLTNLLVEGGAAVLGRFLDAKLVDEVHVFVAPVLVGGATARTPIGGTGTGSLAAAVRPSRVQVDRVENDTYVHAWMSDESEKTLRARIG